MPHVSCSLTRSRPRWRPIPRRRTFRSMFLSLPRRSCSCPNLLCQDIQVCRGSAATVR
jgi:hypothetical protein